MTKPLENFFGIIFWGVRVDVCINRRPSISACNQHNFTMFISKCSFLQNDYIETGFESRNSYIYRLFSISDMVMFEIVFRMSYTLLFCLLIYLKLKINYMRDYLVTQNLFQWNPYDNKCTCRHLNHQVMLITSRDIAVSTFWRPSWTPS